MERRTFLKASGFAPLATGLPRGLSAWLPGTDDCVLVVLELEGGNDGLNTVIPVGDDAYAKARPALSSVRSAAREIGDGFALHESLVGLHGLVREGDAAVIHGVGYPNPDRSHFRSRDIWHTADPDFNRATAETTGWLGRLADGLVGPDLDLPAMELGGTEVALALRSQKVAVPVLDQVDGDPLLVDGRGGAKKIRRRAIGSVAQAGASAGTKGGNDLLGEIASAGAAAVDQAERLRRGLSGYRAKADYPESGLGRQLQLLSRVIVGGFGTRVFHLRHGGYDTHSRQLPTHAALLFQLDQALAALHEDLAGHGLWDRVLVVVYSEFGRRLRENKSQGTDHGAAGPVFALGGKLQAGPHGKAPSLTDLDDGDPRATVDFRQVYAECVRWLGVEAKPVLGRAHGGLTLFD